MFIKDIKNEEVRELAVERCDLVGCSRDEILKVKLGSAFCWAHTLEGDEFWRTLDNDQDSQEAEALIQDVLKPTKNAEDKYTGNRVPLDPDTVVGLGSKPPEDKLDIVGEVASKPLHVDTTGVLNANFIKSPFDYLKFRRSSETTTEPGNVGLYKEPTDKLGVARCELSTLAAANELQERLDRYLMFETTTEKFTVPASGSGRLGATVPKHKLEVKSSKPPRNNPNPAVKMEVTDHRSYNVGKSDYAERKIQPWDIWKEYELDPWDADIVKRILRKKEGESRIMDYEKIKHICDEKIAQGKEKEQLNK